MASRPFSDTTNKNGLIEMCEQETGLGDGTISGDSATLKEFTSRINVWNSQVWSWIFYEFGGFQYQDSNDTSDPFLPQNLVNGTAVYNFPSSGLTVRAVEAEDNNGIMHPLRPITLEQIHEQGEALDEFYDVAGQPEWYRVYGQNVELFPAPNYNATNGLKIHFDRGSHSFEDSDTSDTAGFNQEFHEILAFGASRDWIRANRNDAGTVDRLTQMINDYESRIRKFYRQRFYQLFPPRITFGQQRRAKRDYS